MKRELFSPEEDTALTELKALLKELAGGEMKMILYGSRARGDYDCESDLDIAIIIPGLTRTMKNQLLDKVAEIELKHVIPLSTLILSEDDFQFLKKRERRIALDIEREGIPL
jgi:hypothetical protein